MKYLAIPFLALLLAGCQPNEAEKYMDTCHDKGGTIRTEPHMGTTRLTYRCYGENFTQLIPEFYW